MSKKCQKLRNKVILRLRNFKNYKGPMEKLMELGFQNHEITIYAVFIVSHSKKISITTSTLTNLLNIPFGIDKFISFGIFLKISNISRKFLEISKKSLSPFKFLEIYQHYYSQQIHS